MKSETRGLAALAAQVGNYRLVFRWPERTASLLVPGLVLFSVIIHATAFYVFQVVYPPASINTPPRAQVTFITPGSTQSDALLKWIDAQDPATAARIQEISPAGLGDVHFIPSYQNTKSLPREVEWSSEPVAWPSAHSLLDEHGSKKETRENASLLSVKSSIAFSNTLRDREIAAPTQTLEITVKSAANLRPTVFLAGVGDRGEVRYCFLQESSADAAIDAQAEELLRKRVFSHSEPPLEWGFATFHWGAEAYAPAPLQPAPQPPTISGT